MPDQPELDEFLTIKQLCSMLGIDVTTLYRWQKRGKAPKGYKFGTQAVRFRRADIESWMAQNQLEQAAS